MSNSTILVVTTFMYKLKHPKPSVARGAFA